MTQALANSWPVKETAKPLKRFGCNNPKYFGALELIEQQKSHPAA
jgi:hypothetical protein